MYCVLVPPETDIPDRHTTYSSWSGFNEVSAWHSALALETVFAQSRLVQVAFVLASQRSPRTGQSSAEIVPRCDIMRVQRS